MKLRGKKKKVVFHFLFSSCHVFTLVSVWNLTSHKKWTYCCDTRSWRNAEGLDQSPRPHPLCAVAVIQTKQKKPFGGSWDHSSAASLHHWCAPLGCTCPFHYNVLCQTCAKTFTSMGWGHRARKQPGPGHWWRGGIFFMGSHGPTYSTGLHLQWALILLLPLASHRAPVCYEIRMFYVNRFPRESLIINADSSEGRNPWHLAARTANENVIREVNLHARKKGFPRFSFSLFLSAAPLDPWVHFPEVNLSWHQVTALPGSGQQFLANWSHLEKGLCLDTVEMWQKSIRQVRD